MVSTQREYYYTFAVTMATNALIYSQYHASCTGGSAGETVAMAAGETQL